MILSDVLIWVYFIFLTGLALYGFNALFMSVMFLRLRKRKVVTPLVKQWPKVTVQLPIFNERFVVERLIDAVAKIDYPQDLLSIQVLDDSTDETTTLARARVAKHQEQGINITYLRRPNREGFKAGALAYGLEKAEGEFIAIFDADFVPKADFLRKIIPHFANEKVGAIQARWGHLNEDESPLTRAQALALDGHFVIEQTVRSQTGLLFNFNGSGGVWRKACIEAVGGWQADTIAEDLDLSYRAQLNNWELVYLRDVVAPAEIPSLLTAFKRQQFRWAKGSIQCLFKVGGRVLGSQFSLWRKIQAMLHLGGYLVHPLMLGMLLLGLPVMLLRDPGSFPLSTLGVAGFAPPVLFAISQWATYKDWKRRFIYFPFLVFVGGGIALNNSRAIFEALVGHNSTTFLRTPKFSSQKDKNGKKVQRVAYNVPVDWTTWGEFALSIFCLIEAMIAFNKAPGLMPFLLLYTVGFAYTAWLGLSQSGHIKKDRFSRQRLPNTQ